MRNFSRSIMNCFEVTDLTGRWNKKSPVWKSFWKTDPVETERVDRNFDLWENENNSSTELNNNNNKR